jgi:hypothetical protein
MLFLVAPPVIFGRGFLADTARMLEFYGNTGSAGSRISESGFGTKATDGVSGGRMP